MAFSPGDLFDGVAACRSDEGFGLGESLGRRGDCPEVGDAEVIVPDANSLLEVAVRSVCSSEIGGARLVGKRGSRKDAKTQRRKEESPSAERCLHAAFSRSQATGILDALSTGTLDDRGSLPLLNRKPIMAKPHRKIKKANHGARPANSRVRKAKRQRVKT